MPLGISGCWKWITPIIMLKFLRYLFFLLNAFLLIPVVESGISCSGRIKNCVRNSATCHIRCKERETGVFLIPSHQSCKNATDYDISSTPEVFVNTSLTSDSKFIFLLCCDVTKTLICTQTVSICDEPHQVEDHLIKCKVKIENKTSKPKAVCDIQQNGNFTANISSIGFNENCDGDNKTFTCPLNDLNTNHTFHVFSSGEGFCKNISKETKLIFLPRQFVEASSLIILENNVLKRSVILRLQLPRGIAQYFVNQSWIYRVRSSNANISKTEIVSDEEVTAEIHNLHPYQQYEFHIDWKYEDSGLWSEAITLKVTTQIDVPDTAPSVPGKNYAHGTDVTAIYLQRQPKDSENGPIDEYHVSVKTYQKSDKLFKRNLSKIPFSKTFPGNLRTLFLRLNDGQYHNVSITLATAAGLSEHFTTVYVSPVSIPVENKLHSVEWKPLNESHNNIIITDVLNVAKLFVFSCWGIFDAINQLVICKSNIESKEIKPPRESVLIPSPEHVDVNCVECSLHYGAAVQINNTTSSLLWDSASVTKEKVRAAQKEDDAWIETLIIASCSVVGAILFFIFVLYFYRNWKGFEIEIDKPVASFTSDNLIYMPVGKTEASNELSVISNSLLVGSPESPPDSPLESPQESPLTSESSLTDSSSCPQGLQIMVDTGGYNSTDTYKNCFTS